MLTVCSVTWRGPVKYTFSTKQHLPGTGSTASSAAKKKKKVRKTRDIQQLLYGVFFSALQSKQSEAAAPTREIYRPGKGEIISTAAGKPGRKER